MKKILAIALALVMVFALAACGGPPEQATTPPPVAPGPADPPPATDPPGGQEAPPPAPGTDGTEIILITDLGTIDDRSFNQGSWEGVVKYAQEFGKSYDYIQPAEQGDDTYLNAIDLAVQMGAKVIVTPGFLFEYPIYVAQDTYPNVSFILIDGAPNNGDWDNFHAHTAPNTVGVLYAEEQAGFLAGYGAVMAGYTELGFMGGMAVPAVIRFGHGFIQGAELAAQELGLGDGEVSLNYYYTGVFWPLPEINTMASAWYNDGVEVIFACGGAISDSIFPAAAQAGKFVIGVDVDQSNLSPTVITSAMKGLTQSVYDKLADFFNGNFPGGQVITYSAANLGVGLPMANSKLGSFGQADYDAIFARLVNGSVKVDDDIGIAPDAIPTVKVAVNNLG